MIKWEKEIRIPRNIEMVWELFSPDQMQRIMPNVVEHKPLDQKVGIAGSTYQETYQEGKRQETYTGTILEYEDTSEKKHKKTSFVLGKSFHIQTAYTLIKIDESHTQFIYAGSNEGVGFLGRSLLKLGGTKSNEKVVQDFVELVKEEAMKS